MSTTLERPRLAGNYNLSQKSESPIIWRYSAIGVSLLAIDFRWRVHVCRGGLEATSHKPVGVE
jgi:hypothetical protein